jgi:hypothetical protein
MAKQFSTVVVSFKKLPELHNTPEFFALAEQEKEYLLRATVPTYEGAIMGPQIPPFAEIPEGKEYLSLVAFIGMLC